MSVPEAAAGYGSYAFKGSDLAKPRTALAKARAFLSEPPPSFLRAVFLASVGCLLLSLSFLVRSNRMWAAPARSEETMDELRFMEDLDTSIDPSRKKVARKKKKPKERADFPIRKGALRTEPNSCLAL